VRVTSSLWVSALIRRYNGEGASAVVVRKGAEEAGAVFIIVDRLTGISDLYGPAPQALAADQGQAADRRFQRLVEGIGSEEITARLARERNFDPDLWIVAVEDRDARVLFETV
jgi:hypothetical protein